MLTAPLQPATRVAPFGLRNWNALHALRLQKLLTTAILIDAPPLRNGTPHPGQPRVPLCRRKGTVDVATASSGDRSKGKVNRPVSDHCAGGDVSDSFRGNVQARAGRPVGLLALAGVRWLS